MKVSILLSLLTLSFSSYARLSCGLSGSISERIKDCKSSIKNDSEFVLVSRTHDGYEVYQGMRTGVIWSADLKVGDVNFIDSDVASICSKDHAEFAGINAKWVLPSVYRYIQALKYNIQNVLPNIQESIYWTETSDDFYVNSRYIFEGDNNYVQDSNGNYSFRHLEVEDGYAKVKCIVETIF